MKSGRNELSAEFAEVMEAAEAAPSGRIGLSELFVNWSRNELFIRGYAFSAQAADTPGFAWEGSRTVVSPHLERLSRPDLQKSFPDCPTPLCGFVMNVPLPRKPQLPLKGKLFVGEAEKPLRVVDIELTNRTASFNADVVLSQVALIWPWGDLFAAGALVGDAAPALRSVICGGVELDVRDVVLNKPRKGDGPAKRRPLDLRVPLRRLIGKKTYQVAPPDNPAVEFVFAKSNSFYRFSVAPPAKEKVVRLGAGQIGAVQYSTENGRLHVSGRFFAHFDTGRVEVTLNGAKQTRTASVTPIDRAAATDLELACDAPFSRWTWCDAAEIDPAAPLTVEARLLHGSRAIAAASARYGAGGLPVVKEPLALSYYDSPLRPLFESLVTAAEAVDNKAPVMAFVFPGDMSRTFGGGPSRVMSMAGYFHRMGFRTVLIDRLVEGVVATTCEPPLAAYFDHRLGLGREHLPELARMAFDAATRNETEQAIRAKSAAALDRKRHEDETADLIRRREDPEFNVAAAYLLDRVKPDVVIANFAWCAGVLELLPTSVCKILDTHDLQHVRGEVHFAASGDASLRADKAVELEAWSVADYLVAIQAEEKDAIIATSGRNNVVLAGHAAQTLSAARKGEPAPIVLFVGNRYMPNTEGLRRFLKESWPEVRRRVPDAVLEIAGTVGQDFSAPLEGVRVLGVVPDLAEVYARAAVVINPVEIGTGLSIKLVEALCAGRAVVSTATGMRGFVAENVGVQVAFEGLAEALVRILNDPEERRRLEDAALAFAGSALTPERVYRELFNTIELRLYQ
jgi:glycosyltransferase involved in cell wall biosynthesis